LAEKIIPVAACLGNNLEANMDFNKSTAISDGQEAKKAGYKVPFGTVSITSKAKELINDAIECKWLTKG